MLCHWFSSGEGVSAKWSDLLARVMAFLLRERPRALWGPWPAWCLAPRLCCRQSLEGLR